ncbi:MAG: hypothetical protein FJX65_19465 [Alphaproteobacteria bacterium]|nr:hypothetical protein [Alphaproteobacteria bacterium]
MGFFGEIDDESPARFCVTRAEKVRAKGAPVTHKVFANTAHSFDNREHGEVGRQIFHGARGPFFYRHNPRATEEAYRDLKEMFARELKGGR